MPKSARDDAMSETNRPIKLEVTKEWCEKMAAQEEGHDISAGSLANLPEAADRPTLARAQVESKGSAEYPNKADVEANEPSGGKPPSTHSPTLARVPHQIQALLNCEAKTKPCQMCANIAANLQAAYDALAAQLREQEKEAASDVVQLVREADTQRARALKAGAERDALAQQLQQAQEEIWRLKQQIVAARRRMTR
jgi:hypothetical protein